MFYSPLVEITGKSFSFSFFFFLEGSHYHLLLIALHFQACLIPESSLCHPAPTPHKRTLKIITSLLKFPDSASKGTSTQMSSTVFRIYTFGGNFSSWVKRKEGRRKAEQHFSDFQKWDGDSPPLRLPFSLEKQCSWCFPGEPRA